MGRFKNPGSLWCRQPKQVNDHDFRSDASGLAVPYGIYDVHKNRGTVVVGTSRETPAFAADALEHWWVSEGRREYPNAKALLLLADCGGGNSARARVWKRDLQRKLADRYGLTVVACHYPPGASKWNPLRTPAVSAKSAKTGPVCHWKVMKPCSTTSPRRTTAQGLTVQANPASARIRKRRARHRCRNEKPTLPKAQTAPRMELYDQTHPQS